MFNPRLFDFLKLLLADSPATVSKLAGHFKNKTLKRGDVILNEGEICDSFYFVENGHLVTCFNKEGTDVNVHFHMEGAIITDHRNAKAGLPSKFSIKAGEKSEILILNRKKLEELCNTSEQVRNFGRRLVSHIALNLQEDNFILKVYSPAERYAYIKNKRPELLQRVSLSNLASYLGMNRRTLTRIRSKK